jgi:hypothetical protein
MVFNWVKDEREYFRRNCFLVGYDRLFVCKHGRGFFWTCIVNGQNINPFKLGISEEDFPKTMKEAKKLAEKEYLKHLKKT